MKFTCSKKEGKSSGMNYENTVLNVNSRAPESSTTVRPTRNLLQRQTSSFSSFLYVILKTRDELFDDGDFGFRSAVTSYFDVVFDRAFKNIWY